MEHSFMIEGIDVLVRVNEDDPNEAAIKSLRVVQVLEQLNDIEGCEVEVTLPSHIEFITGEEELLSEEQEEELKKLGIALQNK